MLDTCPGLVYNRGRHESYGTPVPALPVGVGRRLSMPLAKDGSGPNASGPERIGKSAALHVEHGRPPDEPRRWSEPRPTNAERRTVVPVSETQSHLEFFGLREQPFAPTADPVYFYATREHKECLFRLWSSIDQRHGIAVVLGNYGTGKTTLLRKLMTGMAADPDRYNTAVVGSPIPSWTSFSLLESIVTQFGLRPPQP